MALLALVGPGQAAAQERPEPILDQLRATFTQPGLTLGLLLQAVLNPGVDGEPTSARVPEARLLVSGQLDGGFNYLLQTNFAGTPSVLDARVGWSLDILGALQTSF